MFKRLIFLFVSTLVLTTISCDDNIPVDSEYERDFVFLQNIEVGMQPSKVYYDNVNGLFHVFCLGADNNYNGVKDVEDESPSWWVVDRDDIENPEKKIEFEFGYMGFPFRPCFDIESRELIFSQGGKIKIYNIDNFSFVREAGDYYASAISKKGDLLALSLNTEYMNNGELLIYNYKTNEEIGSLRTGLNVQQSIFYKQGNKDMLAVISEGLGNMDAVLQIAEINGDSIKIVKEYEGLGNTANYMAINSENLINPSRLVLVLSGSNEIMNIDLNNFAITSTITTETSGFNGPREAQFVSSTEILVTTYNEDVRLIDLILGEVKKILPVQSKAEGLCYIQDEYLLVCNILNTDYSANNTVSIFDIDLIEQ
jgi:hypothetical protein